MAQAVHEQFTSSSRLLRDSGARVVPMQEVRKLCTNYAQTMRELVVPVRVNVDTDGHAFVNYS